MSSPSTPDGASSRDRRLPCGRDPLDVIDNARAGRSTPHEAGCPHCQAAITADALSDDAARELAQAERDHPVPSTLLPNIMRTVWSDLRRTAMIPLTTDRGSASVADHAVATVIEHALDQLPTLRIHTCTVRLTVDEAESPDAAQGALAVEVTAAAAYNSAVREVADQARDLVRTVVARQFGWAADDVNIAIVDVYVPNGHQQ